MLSAVISCVIAKGNKTYLERPSKSETEQLVANSHEKSNGQEESV